VLSLPRAFRQARAGHMAQTGEASQ
jgi:hypothetical protein